MSAEYEQPAVGEGELVDLDALLEEKPLQYPPAVREARHITMHRRTCACGKDGTPEAHGAIGGRRPFSRGEILEIAARVEAGRRHAARRCGCCPSAAGTSPTVGTTGGGGRDVVQL
jgi:hypothetical protein